jgi:outer membrane protein TolC
MVSRRSKMRMIIVALTVILITGYKESGAQTEISLEKAIAMALEHSFGYQAAQADSISAYYDYLAAKALRYPMLSVNGTSSYTDEIQKIELPVGTIEMGSHENYLAELKVGMPLYTGGKLSNQIKAQKMTSDIKSFSVESQRLNLTYLTRKAYLNVLLSESILKASQSSLKRVEIIRKDIENMFSGGLADSIDILESELAYQKAQRAFNEMVTIRDNAKMALARLIGLDLNAELNLSQQFREPIFPQLLSNYDTMVTGRPELKMSNGRIELAKAIYKSNRAGYFPNLNAFGSYVYGKPNKDLVGKSWNDYYIYGLNLAWEFNLGLKTARNISSARYQIKTAQINYREVEESLNLAIKIAESNLEMAFKTYQITAKEYGAAEEKFRLSSLRYQAGKLSSNRLLEMEEELTAAEHSFRASIINYFLAETEYLYAMGSPRIYGGF